MCDDNAMSTFAGKWEELDHLIDMVLDRDAGEALDLVTLLHEVAKIYVAGQMPQTNEVTYYNTNETLEVIFSGRHVRTANNLIQHLKLLVDDDGVPL